MSLSRRTTAFTLVEMLVVLGIIAILAALLLPVASNAVSRARNAAIALELNQISSAIEAYKTEKGDYPPNFRDVSVVTRHIRRCYPKISPANFTRIFTYDGGGNPTGFSTDYSFDEGESLVFWLDRTTTDPRNPFAPGLVKTPGVAYKSYYAFDESRLETSDLDLNPSYKAKYCKDTYYIYIDSRSYDQQTDEIIQVDSAPRFMFAGAFAEGTFSTPNTINPHTENVTRPYGNDSGMKAINPTSFQLICAGQDGLFGMDPDPAAAKLFPSGSDYTKDDRDNITNFSNGRRLVDNMP